jgi:pyruvate dehydrogenase E1 component alpha subunit
MPLTTVYQGQVQHLQILDEQGKLDEALAKETLTPQDVRALFEQMLLYREFDEAAFKLQRSGRMGTFPQNKGQEATAIGMARAMRKGVDHLVPYYRDNAAAFFLGLPMHYLLLHWMGDERGNAIPASVAVTPVSVEIGAQTLHATGIAWAFKLRHEPRVVVCSFGDGATSTGDFHEAMNFASVFKMPIVFSCSNNGYAISTHTSQQTASATFAQKALAYGMPTIRVDGNDVFAVYKAHRDMIENARAGNGPGFVESVTYRLGDHTTADDARRYRDDSELKAAEGRDPLIRTRLYLTSQQLWDESTEAKCLANARAVIGDVIRLAASIPKPDRADMFNYAYAELPPELRLQRDTMQTHSLGQDPTQLGLKSKPAPASAKPAQEATSS